MRKHTTPLFIFGCLVMMLLGTGCKKKGCTNPDAKNYDEHANEDCACCQFTRLIYYNSTASYYDAPSHRSYDVDSIKIWAAGDSGVIKKVYPTAPADCVVDGNFVVQAKEGTDPSWNIRVFFKGGFYLDDHVIQVGMSKQNCDMIKVF